MTKIFSVCSLRVFVHKIVFVSLKANECWASLALCICPLCVYSKYKIEDERRREHRIAYYEFNGYSAQFAQK